ncbi:MAG TPA: polysaccharide deacetylase family protein [Microthrixaceae bacterium]|nr:polysaccharide deacetylase family protein [Microthrixaceae bacterium]
MTTLAERLGYSAEDRLLIINSDGLGLCHSSNEGVYLSLRDGIATSASLMVPCPWARGAAARYGPEDDVGVHLTLTSEFEHYRWGPITHAPSLLGGAGGFPRTIADVWDHADVGEVHRELRAQVERAIEWGIDVTHLDSHMQTLPLRPEFFDVFLDLAVEFELPIRLPAAKFQEDAGFPFRERAAEEGIVSPDQTMSHSGIGGAQALLSVVSGLPSGVTEIYMNPAVDSAESRALTPNAHGLAEDLAVLTDTETVGPSLDRLGVKLIGWDALRHVQRSLPAQQ